MKTISFSLTIEDIEQAINNIFSRCAIAKVVGLSLFDFENMTEPLLDGWWFDHQTQYFLPPNFSFCDENNLPN